jgi:hypothetical protein
MKKWNSRKRDWVEAFLSEIQRAYAVDWNSQGLRREPVGVDCLIGKKKLLPFRRTISAIWGKKLTLWNNRTRNLNTIYIKKN